MANKLWQIGKLTISKLFFAHVMNNKRRNFIFISYLQIQNALPRVLNEGPRLCSPCRNGGFHSPHVVVLQGWQCPQEVQCQVSSHVL